MRVPFVDLKAQYDLLKAELDEAIFSVVSNTAFVSGRYAADFERAFAEYIGVRHCVGVANGTDALELALRAVGVNSGDEVIVPANTFYATAEAVVNIGARPVFVDVVPDTYNIETGNLEAAITARTAAIIPVHLYGLPADMTPIVEIAKHHGLRIVEDCAQAHGAKHNGQSVGTFGDAATFSFYPSKNLGAFGDAGAVITNDSEVEKTVRAIANHGQLVKNHHALIGRNSRLDGIQAAVLSVKLRYLDGWIEARRANASSYNELLSASGVVLPTEPPASTHTYHLYVVQVPDRAAVRSRLADAGIETGIHYPTALPFLEPFGYMGHKPDDFPVAYSQMSRLLSLPMYAELTSEMIEAVCEGISSALRSTSGANAS